MSTKTRTYRTPVPTTPDALYAWHGSSGAFDRLSPPWRDVEVMSASGTIQPGDRKRLRLPLAGPLGITWELVHSDDVDAPGFVDTQVKGPFRTWRHEHRFRSDGHGEAILEDRLEYGLPFGPVGHALASSKVDAELDRLFELRHARTRIDLERLHRRGSERPLRIAVTGSTGLVGERLIGFLRAGGHQVFRVVRRERRGDQEIFWNPAEGQIDAAGLEGMDAVVHLAGVSISGGLWTEKRKTAIRESRVKGTDLLARTLANLEAPPKVLVSTSGVNYYGDGGDRVSTESTPPGEGFLTEVTRVWEAAAEPAIEAGIRVVHPRFGIVMAGEGGMLPLISLPFKLGLGGPVGNGKQWMSWIALDDLVGVLYETILNEELSGPINATSPEPVTNAEFTRTLGMVLKRPTVFRVPAFAARAVGGLLAKELILPSQRVVPARLEEIGFRFAFPTLESALRHELGRYDGHRASAEVSSDAARTDTA
jgi:uncharacterized protein